MATDTGYAIGHAKGALGYMRFRTAERSCAFFRDLVGSRNRILDCGCGPGSITIGLAEWASDGETVGIDLGAEQLDGARTLAREHGVRNVSFRQASIFELPFADESFDVVFSQAVLFHVPDTEKALAEMKRVLRRGGLIALRDAITSSIIVSPDDPFVRELGRMVHLGAQHLGGRPDVGLELGTLLAAAGFADVFFTVSFEQPEHPEERAAYFNAISGVIEGNLTTLGVSQGWATAETLAQVPARCRAFADIPGSLYALPFGQATGRKH